VIYFSFLFIDTGKRGPQLEFWPSCAFSSVEVGAVVQEKNLLEESVSIAQ
jgi:hypothetical protein